MTDSRGFLTDTDILFLRGGKQYDSKQQRYKRRQAIRERTRQAFYDFQLLHEELDAAERNKIFDPPAQETYDLVKAMSDTFAFIYHALEGDAGSNAATRNRSFKYPFDQVLEAGIRHGEIARQEGSDEFPFGGRVDVTFEVDVQQLKRVDQDRVLDDLAKNFGRGLTDDELRTAILHAARATVVGDGFGEAMEDRFGVSGHGLHALADRVERRAEELDLDDADDVDE